MYYCLSCLFSLCREPMLKSSIFIPRIGLNLANTYPESFADMRPGLNIGVAEEIRFSKLFALEPGVYYSMQGYQKKTLKARQPG